MIRTLLLSLLLLPAASCANWGNSTAAKRYDRGLSLQGITFHIQPYYEGSINRLRIIPGGLTSDNSSALTIIDGIVTGAEVADLNTDRSPEIYVYITSPGSGSYGSLVAYSANDKKSMSPIYFPSLNDDKTSSRGYMGHDEFAIVENTLARRFPIYKEGDSDANPTGGTRQLQYKLEADEATWNLRLDKASDGTF